jgi:hypothetical protein
VAASAAVSAVGHLLNQAFPQGARASAPGARTRRFEKIIEALRFGLIVFVTVLDHIAHEIVWSFNTTRDFVRYRVRWIVVEKARSMWPGRR